jgi:hypothetical protein
VKLSNNKSWTALRVCFGDGLTTGMIKCYPGAQGTLVSKTVELKVLKIVLYGNIQE